ncbi:hypothetical protein BpHYR1_000903 [Brachionus plicatilis]|uniref:Uncharacterized protein n=1 Tax=Brachionus plicatilis TaxID=10195 RepID=A0A3M7SF28_BRAPC|nr:hypothetical protein BpHYR1_000903 [Brachionus plicatilis]
MKIVLNENIYIQQFTVGYGTVANLDDKLVQESHEILSHWWIIQVGILIFIISRSVSINGINILVRK